MHNYVILDTEGTGKGDRFPFDQICQVGLTDADGKSLMYELVRPTIPIPPESTAIHGITDETVAEARSFAEVLPDLLAAIAGRTVWIYNAGYDMRMMLFSAAAHGLHLPAINAQCAMLQYASMFGQPGHDGPKWHKLGAAYEQQVGRTFIYGHDALDDCVMTSVLMSRMEDPAGFRTFTDNPFPVYLTTLEVRYTVRNEPYARFETAGGQGVNVFRPTFGRFKGAGFDVSDMIATLMDKRPAGYVHEMAIQIPAHINYAGDYPEVVSVDTADTVDD